MAKLLVSVRSATEARAALAGGAVLIDVKEPRLGSLGAASTATTRAVYDVVRGQCPVSAARGELVQAKAQRGLPPLAYVKWGLSQCGSRRDWTSRLLAAHEAICQANPEIALVAVSYADWERANAPLPKDVCAFACRIKCGAFLIDTWCKDERTLLDWLPINDLAELCQSCHRAGVPVALAGSLTETQIACLLPLRPTWFAVRGAVCHGGKRTRLINVRKVRALAELIEAPTPAAKRAG